MTVERPNAPPALDRIREDHQRLAILRIVQRSPGYSSNLELLGDCLRALGLTACQEDMRSLCRFLSEAGLVESHMVERVTVLTLTRDGHEVAEGVRHVDGVCPPGPDCVY